MPLRVLVLAGSVGGLGLRVELRSQTRCILDSFASHAAGLEDVGLRTFPATAATAAGAGKRDWVFDSFPGSQYHRPSQRWGVP